MSINEKISALIDRQLSGSEQDALFTRLRNDPGARETWRRYHLIGGVMRGEVGRCDTDLSARIGAQLKAEPTLLAPASLSWSRPRNRRVFAVAASLAASLAVVAMFALRPGPQDVQLAANPDALLEQEFELMLLQHGEFAASPGMNGLMVYTKLVSDQQRSSLID